MADTLTRRAKPATNGKAPQSPAQKATVKSNHILARCQPRGDRVVVRREMPQSETKGGILLPDAYKTDKRPVGVVHAVGPGRYENGVLIPMGLKVGDTVIITSWAGIEVKEGLSSNAQDEEFVMLREEDILATVPSDTDI